MTNLGEQKGGQGWVYPFIALCAGVSIANCYAMHPALPAMAQSLGIPLQHMGLVAGAVQIGFLCGILFLGPLGDRYPIFRLVQWQFAMLAVSLTVMATSRNLNGLIVSGVFIGAMSTNSVHLAGLAFKISPPQTRGVSVGTVATGISAGILLSRFVGGTIASTFDWQSMFLIFAAIALAFCFASGTLLPKEQPSTRGKYLDLLASLPRTWTNHRLLREGAVAGGCWFYVFSMLWVSLMLHVCEQPIGLTQGQAGLIGLAGAAGLFATRPAGRLADKFGARKVVLGGMALLVAGVLVLQIAQSALIPIVIGVIVFDVGCFSAQVANQTRLMTIDPNARSRIYSAYMLVYYLAGAAGSAMGPLILENWGWSMVLKLCLAVSVAGCLWITFHVLRESSGAQD